MFISPQTAIDNGWITGVTNNPSPNAIDFTLDTVYTIDNDSTFFISNDEKKMRGGSELKTTKSNNQNLWTLNANTVYDGMSSMYVNIPEGIAALLIVRSTLNRNGLFITSGLFDSLYEGHIGFALHNRSGPAVIEQGTRVGQIIFVESDNDGGYAGGYNHKLGTHATN